MQAVEIPAVDRQARRARELFDQQWRNNACRTDRMFAVLMLLQWLAAILLATVISPRTWNGAQSNTHPHVWLAVFFGGAIAALPLFFAWKKPGDVLTRQVIGIAQMMFSSLLIHVSGGRIETHFHVFGSLAFLAFYRDWRVLVPATLIVAVDHFVRGLFWPQTVFGIVAPEPWRWLEHAGWVIYEDIFLIISCRHGVREMWASARRTAELEQINRDMREQKAELETAYRSKQAIVETALDAVVSMDCEGRISAWNSQAEATFGYRADEVIGACLAEIIIPERHREAHRRGLASYLASGKTRMLNRRIELSAMHRGGHEFPVELSISPIRSDDSVSFCAFIRDITLRQEAAAALQTAKNAAEAASHAKSAFLANMSHEIRTPLNGILGFADLMLGRSEELTSEQTDHLQTIHASGEHLLALINDVLDLSKIESGLLDVERIRCSPHEIIESTVAMLRARAEQRGLLLSYEWSGSMPEAIHSDPARVRQILVNLVGNAIKFTETGSVRVAARLETGETPQIVIDVIDTGVGIEADARSRIFEPFVQADTSITRRFGGTGLGLSISRRLARLLGGELTFESEPGRGSTFTLALLTGSLDGIRIVQNPRGGTSPRAMAAASNRPTLSGRRILVVEDGITNRKLIHLVLEQAGASTHVVENGEEGVAAALAEPFDLILMDMQMPVMDGYTATRELRRRGSTLPIIALTAHAMTGDEQKCLAAGCSGYLSKPIAPRRLLEAVAAALQHTPISPVVAPAAEPAEDVGGPLVSSLPMDDADFREIAEEFIARFAERLAALTEAVGRNDRQQVSEIGHWLKGAGGTAGFDVLTEPARQLEQLAATGAKAELETQIRKLEGLLRRMHVPAGV